MRRPWLQIVPLGLVIALAGAALFPAQFSPAQPKTPLTIQDLFSPLPGSAQAAAAGMPESSSDPSYALQVVVSFLQLRPDQVEQLQQLLQARQEQLAPRLQAIAELENRLRELLDSGGSPPDVGQVVIEIHALQAQAAQLQASFLANFENLLDPAQRQRLDALRLAARVKPLLPAFQQLQLL